MSQSKSKDAMLTQFFTVFQVFLRLMKISLLRAILVSLPNSIKLLASSQILLPEIQE